MADHDPPQLPIRFTGAARALIVAGLLLFALWLFLSLGGLTVPLILAGLFAYVLHPLISLLTRRSGWPRLMFVVGLFALVGGSIAWLGSLAPQLLAQVEQLRTNLPFYMDELRTTFAGFGLRLDDTAYANLKQSATGLKLGSDQLAAVARGAGEAILLLLVFFPTAFYLLLVTDRIAARIRAAVPPQHRAELYPLIAEVDGVLGSWVRGEVMLVIVMSVLLYIALALLGLAYALPVAVISGLLLIIPYVGPYVAGAIAVLVALVQPEVNFGWSNATLAIAVVVAYFVLRNIENYFIGPIVMSRVVKLSALLVLAASVVGAAIIGVLGIFLAVPTVAVGKVLLTFLLPRLYPSQPIEVGGQVQPLQSPTDLNENQINAALREPSIR